MFYLHPHNEATYQTLTTLFKTESRVACVQPTGTGKSFLVLRLIAENPRSHFLLASPSVYIFQQLKNHAKNYRINLENCIFLTYAKLSMMCSDDLQKIKCNYIVLDEFHRCGAVEWGSGVTRLLEGQPTAKVLGTSATPIRYLDSCRDMAEEIFHHVYAVNMSLGEAIRKKILPLPVYVTSWYAFSGEMKRLEIRASHTQNPKLKQVLFGKLQKAKRMIAQQDCNLETIFKKHIPNGNGRYIVFCSSIENLITVQKESRSWFAEVNSNLHTYSVYASNSKAAEEFQQFQKDNDPTALKLLFCVDMLNEGVHVEGVQGVIMLRATQSANVFYQQLGRALTCADRKQSPVIFDIVNNYETGDTAKMYCDIMEISRANGTSSDDDITFELYDYVRDIREILDEIHNSFESEWELVFETLQDFLQKYDRFPTRSESMDGILLGQWCITQRHLYKNGKLSKERVQQLESIHFSWDWNEENWQGMLEACKSFYEKKQRFPNKSDTDEMSARLYRWLMNQRVSFKKGTLSESRIEKLRAIGFTVQSVSADEKWEMQYANLKKYQVKNGRFPTFADSKNSDEAKVLYEWMHMQIKNRNRGKLSEDRLEKLNELGLVWNPMDEKWLEKLAVLKQFIAEKGRVPKQSEKYGNLALGQWYLRQLNAYKSGSLSTVRAEKFRALRSDVGDL